MASVSSGHKVLLRAQHDCSTLSVFNPPDELSSRFSSWERSLRFMDDNYFEPDDFATHDRWRQTSRFFVKDSQAFEPNSRMDIWRLGRCLPIDTNIQTRATSRHISEALENDSLEADQCTSRYPLNPTFTCSNAFIDPYSTARREEACSLRFLNVRSSKQLSKGPKIGTWTHLRSLL